jgi:hypothetical protein
VEQLSQEKQILHTRGMRRGIRLIDRGDEMSQADMLLRLAPGAGQYAATT